MNRSKEVESWSNKARKGEAMKAGTTKRVKAKTTDAVTVLKNRITNGDPKKLEKLERELEQEKMALQIGQTIYDLRKKAGLTQQELANMVGTKKSAISRIEDADYGGHSISMLLKIAVAVGMKLEVKFKKNTSRSKSTKRKVGTKARVTVS